MVWVEVAVEENDSHGAIFMTTRLMQQKRLNATPKERLKSPSQSYYHEARTQPQRRFPFVMQCEDGHLTADMRAHVNAVPAFG